MCYGVTLYDRKFSWWTASVTVSFFSREGGVSEGAVTKSHIKCSKVHKMSNEYVNFIWPKI